MSLNYKLFNFFFLAANKLQTFNLKILKILVGVAGFEPATLWSQTRCATRLRYTPKTFVIAFLLTFSIKRKR